jgi:hypothetical protein
MNKEKVMMDKERSFSIELDSKQNLKTLNLKDGSSENVLIEGSLGEFTTAQFVEDTILEVVGTSGVLRVNVAKAEITEAKQP